MLLQQGTQQLQRCDGSMKTIRCMPSLGFDCTLVCIYICIYTMSWLSLRLPTPPAPDPTSLPHLNIYIHIYRYLSIYLYK